MRKVNTRLPSFSLVVPEKYDLAQQFELAHPNLGFDNLTKFKDAENGVPLLQFKQELPAQTKSEIVKQSLQLNTEVRRWLKHLFGPEYEKVAKREEPLHYWRYLINFSDTATSKELEDINEFQTEDKTGPHIKTEERNGSPLIRFKYSTFEALHDSTRVKFTELLEDL